MLLTPLESEPMAKKKKKKSIVDVFGENVARLREAKGMNQTDFAYHIESHPSHISKIEKGLMARGCTILIVEDIADALGCTIAELFER